jgi:putative restriction endonuclease
LIHQGPPLGASFGISTYFSRWLVSLTIDEGHHLGSLSQSAEKSLYPALMSIRKPWNEDDLLVAMNLYHKLTFGQFHQRQPVIVEVASKLGRTPGSVAMKLSNLASLDPAMKLRDIVGLRGDSMLDRTVWKAFHKDLEKSVPASEEAFRRLFTTDDEDEVSVVPKVGV